jgi:hypothetical protein
VTKPQIAITAAASIAVLSLALAVVTAKRLPALSASVVEVANLGDKHFKVDVLVTNRTHYTYESLLLRLEIWTVLAGGIGPTRQPPSLKTSPLPHTVRKRRSVPTNIFSPARDYGALLKGKRSGAALTPFCSACSNGCSVVIETFRPIRQSGTWTLSPRPTNLLSRRDG